MAEEMEKDTVPQDISEETVEEKGAPQEQADKKAEKKKKKVSPEKEELEKVKQELADQKQQYLRVLAEYDNFRKRSQSEKNGIYSSAVCDTVQEILPIADNIERALEQKNASNEDMYKGVEMIAVQIKASFEKLDIKEIGAVGDTFDPALHNAVAHIDDESMGENVVAAVYQKGYSLGNKVVRHAMVQVAN